MSGSLDDHPDRWQLELFHDKMNSLKDKREAFIFEKECYDRDEKNLFADEIQEWMAILKCPPYTKASQMKLFRTVNGIEVEMLIDTLRRVAQFDSKPANKYMFPSLDDLYFKPKEHPMWNTMLEVFFYSK
ncbi:hypothetical protein Hanom_Chr05g00417581 [Helianthus anomalus]